MRGTWCGKRVTGLYGNKFNFFPAYEAAFYLHSPTII